MELEGLVGEVGEVPMTIIWIRRWLRHDALLLVSEKGSEVLIFKR